MLEEIMIPEANEFKNEDNTLLGLLIINTSPAPMLVKIKHKKVNKKALCIVSSPNHCITIKKIM
ncbi:MAG: hypothetical protein J6T74_10195 [Clostridia bacterium]|nr:hypothetical protein [Clostridia bacterium]